MIPPRNVADLQRELRRAASTNEEFAHWQVVMANVIAGQFLDGAVMRGGAALKLRYGDADTRYTMDFDASRSIDEAEFVDRYSERLAVGWNGFTGRIVRVKKPRPRNVPGQYVMQPFEIKLSYNNRPWCTVDFELSYNEVGDADRHDLVKLPEEVLAIFRKLGLQEPKPFPLMRIEHQIAQKLHGVTDPDYVRVQDLIDLQLMMSHEEVDLSEIRSICRRLFANRKKHQWPAKLNADTEEWHLAYERIKGELLVLPTVEEAVAWVNDLIDRIAKSVKEEKRK